MDLGTLQVMELVSIIYARLTRLGFAVPFDLVHKVEKTETRHCAWLNKTKNYNPS